MTAQTTTPTPKRLIPAILPTWYLNIQKPTPTAVRMVVPMEKTPQGLPLSAFTTANPKPARATTTMMKIATAPATAAAGLISWRMMSTRDRPFRLTEAVRIMKSCTAPAKQTPMRSQRKPGRNPNWAAKTGPIRGPEPAMLAKCWPKSTKRWIGL